MKLPVREDAKINIKASADLSIEGVSERFLTAIVQQGECLKILERHDGLDIKATDDCRLMIPESAIITVEKVGGDLFIKGISERVIVGKVGGDLAMQELGGASIETVGGDTGFKQISGTLEIARTGGDLDGEGAAGLTSRAVGGDAAIKEISGEVNLKAGGDIEFSSSSIDLSKMEIQAGGDITFIVTPQTNAQLDIYSGGDSINVDACGQQGDWEMEQVSLPLGNGGSVITLRGGGDIRVTDHEQVSSNYQDIFDRTSDEWEKFAVDLKRTIKEGLDAASGSIEQAMQTVGKIGDKAGIRIEYSSDRNKERDRTREQKRKMVGFSYDEPEAEKVKNSGKASDEERMIVLRMLQEKKISIEEAEKLLNALDR